MCFRVRDAAKLRFFIQILLQKSDNTKKKGDVKLHNKNG